MEVLIASVIDTIYLFIHYFYLVYNICKNLLSMAMTELYLLTKQHLESNSSTRLSYSPPKSLTYPVSKPIQIQNVSGTTRSTRTSSPKSSPMSLSPMNKHIRYHTGGGVILINERDQILIVFGNNGQKSKWGFPKGKKQTSDKSIFDCAKRELEEETGISLFDLTYEDNGQISKDGLTLYVYKIQTTPSVVIDEAEIKEYRWVLRDELNLMYKKGICNRSVSYFMEKF